jgi:hypothetical protein
MNNKITDGKWNVEAGNNYGFKHMAVFSGNAKICDVLHDPDARLISAAPEMYEALKKALQIIEAEKESCGIYKSHIELIKSAIAKAEKQ